jgi:formate dehydrogenase subunit gamma
MRRPGIAFLTAFILMLAATLAPVGVGIVLFGPPAFAQKAVDQPSNVRGQSSPSDEWRAVKGGLRGDVTLPDKAAGVLIQPGEKFREWRNGTLYRYGLWTLGGMIVVIVVYFAIRGRIRIDSGWSGTLVERFSGFERFTHWLTATSFIILGLSGLNMLYGRHLLLPLIGPPAFSWLTRIGKVSHDYVAFAFMLGIVMMFAVWVGQNIPGRIDWVWLRRGGGMFRRGDHPPAEKFNAGQKIMFWLVILFGVSVSLSGLALLFPASFVWFAGTFKFLNLFGFHLPTELAPLQETQLSQLWHAAVALLFVAVIIAHIYIGTLGMEGAFDAMGTGKVDANWAREHHRLWFAKTLEEERLRTAADD